MSLTADLAGKRILVTGHTGFKGSWMTLWLSNLGVEVHGIALDPDEGALFDAAELGGALASDRRIDIRDLAAMRRTVSDVSPDAVIHLAAQPLVRDSYRHPVDTFSTNVMGTVNTLVAAMATPSVRAALIITTDKVYRNLERHYAYKEDDPLGGEDPYSASKACAELATHALDRSQRDGQVAITTVRSGNVLGGGDTAKDRLLPDLLASFRSGTPAVLRYPDAVRPWQHVLDPLHGYLRVVGRLLHGHTVPSLNLGPDPAEALTVLEVARIASAAWGSSAEVVVDATDQPHEAGLLHLDSSLARDEIGWEPVLSGAEAIEWTVAWDRRVSSGISERAAMDHDLDAFERRLGFGQ